MKQVSGTIQDLSTFVSHLTSPANLQNEKGRDAKQRLQLSMTAARVAHFADGLTDQIRTILRAQKRKLGAKNMPIPTEEIPRDEQMRRAKAYMETYEGLWGEVNLDDLADTLVFSGIAFSRQKVHMLSDDCRLWKNFPGLSVDALQKIEENHVVPIDEKALKEIENGVWHSLFIQSLRQGQ